MSIKAKIEAIIYAAEEPVTFAQIFELIKIDAREELLHHQLEAEAAAANAAANAAAQATATQVPAESAGEQVDVSNETVTQIEERVAEAGLDAAALSPESISGVIPAEDDHESNLAAEPLPDAVTEAVADSAPEATAQEAPAEAAAGVTLSEITSGEAASAEAESPATAPAEVEPATPVITDAEVKSALRAAIEELIADYNSPARGIEVRQIAGGYRMATKPEQHDVVRAFAKSLKPPVRLSLQALETLAVIAYKQPITAPEISEVRGVDTGGVLGTLLDRKLITTAGRKQVIGRPILYKTTKEFLLRFGLKDVNELPSMEEFEKLAAESIGADLFAPPTPDQAAAQTAAAEAPVSAAPAGEEEYEEALAANRAASNDVSPETAEAQTASMEAPLASAEPSGESAEAMPLEESALVDDSRPADATADTRESTSGTRGPEVESAETGDEAQASELPAENES